MTRDKNNYSQVILMLWLTDGEQRKHENVNRKAQREIWDCIYLRTVVHRLNQLLHDFFFNSVPVV